MFISQSRLFGGKNTSGVFAAGALAFSACLANAATITPVTATANSGSNTSTYSSTLKLIDGSNLTQNNINGLHNTSAFVGGMWQSARNPSVASPVTVVFDLGANYDLSNAYIWQFNQDNSGAPKGAKDLSILTSADNITFTPSSTIQLTEAPLNAGGTSSPVAAQVFSLSGVADNTRYVEFDITSNYGFNGATGLSEVKFAGTPAAPTPEPASLAAVAVAGLAALRRRRA